MPTPRSGPTPARVMELNTTLRAVSGATAVEARENKAKPRLAQRLGEAGHRVMGGSVGPGGVGVWAKALNELTSELCGVTVATSGTRISRAIPPEATMRVLDREAPGLSEIT